MKRHILIPILCVILTLCSCQSKDTKEGYIENYEELIQVSKDIDFGDTSYNMETDSQNYFNFDSGSYAATADGYYTFWDSKIYFIDRETFKCLPLCSKTDCLHDDEQCDAYLDVTVSKIKYYDGSLYTVLHSFNESSENLREYSLYRISLDGSRREKVFVMYSTTERSTVPGFIIHRGYVYYQYEDGENYCLIRCNIDGSDPQEIYRINSDSGVLSNFCGYGDGILFCDTLDRTKIYGDRIIYYSQTADELYMIADGVNVSFVATEDAIIYTDGSDMMKSNISDLDTEVLVEDISGLVKLSYDGEYVYVDNLDVLWNFSEPESSDYTDRRIDVYDTDGEIVDSVSLEGESHVADFGDKEYMFFSFSTDSGYQKRAFDKSQIGTESHKWTDIEGLSY